MKKKQKTKKTDENSGQYVIANIRSPERRPLECCTLMPKYLTNIIFRSKQNVGSKKHWVQENVCPKKCRVKKVFGPNKF